MDGGGAEPSRQAQHLLPTLHRRLRADERGPSGAAAADGVGGAADRDRRAHRHLRHPVRVPWPPLASAARSGADMTRGSVWLAMMAVTLLAGPAPGADAAR